MPETSCDRCGRENSDRKGLTSRDCELADQRGLVMKLNESSALFDGTFKFICGPCRDAWERTIDSFRQNAV